MQDAPLTFDEDALKARIDAAFGAQAGPPAMSLRAGNALDDYDAPPPWDAALDTPEAGYLEDNQWGLPHLDAASWLHYLPILLRHAVERFHGAGPSMAIPALLFSLRPPDREPPRFATLSPEQEAVVVQFLDLLAFDPRSRWTDEAMTALEEYWAPGAIYR